VIFTVLAQEGGIAWMHARHPHSGGSFIIATAVSDEEEERATRLLKNEFALRDMLQDSWAIRAVASTQYRGRFALVYAPFSFELLARARAGRSRDRALYRAGDPDLRSPAPDASAKPDPRRYQARQHFCSSRCHLPSGQLWPPARSPISPRPGLPFQAVRPPMSPEHTTRTQRPVDSRSDLYSLGMVLYELLTGRLPFELGEDDQTNWAHYHIAAAPLPRTRYARTCRDAVDHHPEAAGKAPR
jgi:hypothetical protein